MNRCMKPEGVGFTADYPGDLLNALAIGLAADTSESAKKSLDVVRARSPELLRMSEQTGDDMPTSSVGFTEVLLMSLRSDIELPWPHFEQRAREEGRCGVHKVRRVRCRTRKRSLSSPKQGPVAGLAPRDSEERAVVAAIFAILGIIYLVVARETVGFTLGEALLDARYHPRRRPRLHRAA